MGLSLKNINKAFGKNQILNDLDLDIRKGEFHTLLGPSGAGKSVLLDIVAGLIKQDSGSISFSGQCLSNTPPEFRSIGYVFQDFSLFPHLNVEENIAFGLDAQGLKRDEISGTIQDYVDILGLENLRKRLPSALSGGEKQRTAIARAMVLNPEIMLFDEPLSHLDKSLQRQLMFELRSIHEKTGITCLYVTHNREEAMSLADRVSVLHNGQVVQTDKPEEVYYRPKTKFVAKFLGAENIIDVIVKENKGNRSIIELKGDQYSFPIELDLKYFPIFSKRKELSICLHSEKLRLGTEPHAQNSFPITIKNMYLMDALVNVTALCHNGLELELKIPRDNFDISARDFFVEINDDSFYPICGRCQQQVSLSECCEYYVPEFKPDLAKVV